MKIFGFNFSIKAANTEKKVPVKDQNMGSFNQLNSVFQPKNSYQTNTIVYSVIKYILREISKAEFYLIEVNGSKMVEVESHKILDLLKTPNPLNGKNEFLEKVFGYKFINGESFIYFMSPENGINKGLPIEMYCVPPKYVKIFSDEYGVPTKYRMGYSDNNSIDVLPENVVHLKYFNPDGQSLRGLSPLSTAANSVLQSDLAYANNIDTLQKNGIQGLFVYNSDNEFDDFDEISQSALEDKWNKKNKEKSIMVTNAKLKWEQVGLKSTDLDLLNTIKFSVRDICNIYGISSQLMNDPDNKTYANVKEARVELISNIVIPEIELMLTELTNTIAAAYGLRDGKKYIIKLNKDIYPELKEANASFVNSLMQAYWLTGNEKRQAQDYGIVDIPEMNDIFIPNNLTPIDIAGANENINTAKTN